MSALEVVSSARSTAADPSPVTSSPSPSRPENSVEPVSETTTRRRTSARRSEVSGYAAEPDVVVDLALHGRGVQAEPVREVRGLLGPVADHGGEQPGADPQPGAQVDQVGARGAAGRRVRPGRAGRPRAASTWQTRAAATRARISLLAYSVAVRSGIIRNAE